MGIKRTPHEVESSNRQFVWLICTTLLIEFGAIIACELSFQNQSYSLILILAVILCDIICVVCLFFRFTYTFPFQAGMVKLMFDDLQLEWGVGVAFLLLCLVYRGYQIIQIMSVNARSLPNDPSDQVLIVIYRVAHLLFYYYVQRASLKLCDLKYYYDSDWFKERSTAFAQLAEKKRKMLQKQNPSKASPANRVPLNPTAPKQGLQKKTANAGAGSSAHRAKPSDAVRQSPRLSKKKLTLDDRLGKSLTERLGKTVMERLGKPLPKGTLMTSSGLVLGPKKVVPSALPKKKK
ncbi:hypothetical protein HDV03_004374 [Kappamyces sp. JEL0829]|nr:hypothetical protein HDV03_004374 [Kappamyces sp. JEL0829]